jgi:hypothetical protein
MTYDELSRLIAGRLRTAGIVEASSAQVDIGEVHLTLLSLLGGLVQAYDLDSFTLYVEHWFATEAGEPMYDLPEDFGRLITPREPGESGVFLHAGTLTSELTYQEAREAAEHGTQTEGIPSDFTLVAPGRLWLSPTPDDNHGDNYTVGGVYVRQIHPSTLTGTVPTPLVSALEHLCVGQIADDKGVNNARLQAKAAEARTHLINAEARRRQRFQHPTRRR